MKESHTREHWRKLSKKRLHRLPEAANDRWVLLGRRNLVGTVEYQLVFVHKTQGGFCSHGFTHCLIPTLPWEIRRVPRRK